MAHDDSVGGDGQGEIALSIDETNALRVKLGLKPLTEGKASAKEQEAEQNYAKHKEEEAKKAQRKELIDKIAKEKEKARREHKLQGFTLGAASDEEDQTGDSLAWVQRQKQRDEKRKTKAKKKAMELARKKAAELEEMDEAATQTYRSSDLKGLRIEHDLEDVATGGETILTLKDSTIEENEEDGDVLQSVQLADLERNRKNVENKKKKNPYNVYDDEEFAALGEKRNILSQYDEELNGPKTSGFVINEEGTIDLEQKRKAVSEKLKANAISLAYEKTQEIKDYYTQEEMVSFKKPKKKKKPRRERKYTDFELEDESGIGAQATARESGSRRRGVQDTDMMDIVEAPDAGSDAHKSSEPRVIDYGLSNRNTNIDDVNFVDDDDLQSALARARRLQTQKRNNTDIEEIAKAAREIKEDEPQPEGAVVLSATSEFVRNLTTAPVVKASEPQRSNRPALPKDDTEERVQQMELDEDVQEERGGWDDGEEQASPIERPKEKQEEEQGIEAAMPAPIDEEPLVGAGLAATIALLTQKGFVEKATPEALQRERKQAEKRAWLAEQKRIDRLRELEKEKEKERNRERNQKGRGGHRDDRDWYREEQEARYAERERAREVEERFRHYIPDVNLEYHDEHGRKLNAKEAFRQLSHKFHGKASGKMKTEKRLKKIEDELKMEKMSSSDTPLGTANALLERTKAAGAAHVVLSIGNRGVLPANISLMDAKPSKPVKETRKTVPTTTVMDTARNVNTYNREKVAFGIAGVPSGASKRKASESIDDAAVAKKFKEDV